MERHQHTLKLMSYLLAALISRASTFSAYKRTQCLLKTLVLVDLVAMPEGPHPIPFRTRSLSLPGPMVLRLKSRESRSSPGLPRSTSVKTLHYKPPKTVRPTRLAVFLLWCCGVEQPRSRCESRSDKANIPGR